MNRLTIVRVDRRRRGVGIREAFSTIDRYRYCNYWASTGLFEYVQVFVISNGALTRYHSTRGALAPETR